MQLGASIPIGLLALAGLVALFTFVFWFGIRSVLGVSLNSRSFLSRDRALRIPNKCEREDDPTLVSIASLMPDAALALWQYLKSEGISAELVRSTDESGVEKCNVLVPGDYAQNASWLAETWEMGYYRRRRCPACASEELDYLSHASLDEIGKCKDCGCEFELK